MGIEHTLGLICHQRNIMNPPCQHHNTLGLLCRPHNIPNLHCPPHSIRDPRYRRHSIPNQVCLPHNILDKLYHPHNTQSLYSYPHINTQDPHSPPHNTQNQHLHPHNTHHWLVIQYLPCPHTITPNNNSNNNTSYIITLHWKMTENGVLTTSPPASCPSLPPQVYIWCPQRHPSVTSSFSSRERCSST